MLKYKECYYDDTEIQANNMQCKFMVNSLLQTLMLYTAYFWYLYLSSVSSADAWKENKMCALFSFWLHLAGTPES